MRHRGREKGYIQAGLRNPDFISCIGGAANNKSQYQRDAPLLFHHSPFIVPIRPALSALPVLETSPEDLKRSRQPLNPFVFDTLGPLRESTSQWLHRRR